MALPGEAFHFTFVGLADEELCFEFFVVHYGIIILKIIIINAAEHNNNVLTHMYTITRSPSAHTITVNNLITKTSE